MRGVKLTSSEAYERGLVTRVYPHTEFNEKQHSILPVYHQWYTCTVHTYSKWCVRKHEIVFRHEYTLV